MSVLFSGDGAGPSSRTLRLFVGLQHGQEVLQHPDFRLVLSGRKGQLFPVRMDERKIVVLRSDASDKTAKQNESDDHFRLADHSGVDAIFVNTSAFSRTDSHDLFDPCGDSALSLGN